MHIVIQDCIVNDNLQREGGVMVKTIESNTLVFKDIRFHKTEQK